MSAKGCIAPSSGIAVGQDVPASVLPRGRSDRFAVEKGVRGRY